MPWKRPITRDPKCRSFAASPPLQRGDIEWVQPPFFVLVGSALAPGPLITETDGMSSGSTNRLVPIDQSNWRDALRVRVSDEQLPMAADSQPIALVILAKAYVRDGGRRWEPLAYLSPDGTIIADALTHTDDIVEVRNLAVDIEHQGAGVGTELLGAVLDRCRAQGSTSVELTFHPANEVAARLYKRAGFAPTEITRNGEPLWSISLAGPSHVE